MATPQAQHGVIKHSLLISHSRDFIDHHHLGLMAAEAFRGSSPEKVHTLRAPVGHSRRRLYPTHFGTGSAVRKMPDGPSRLTSCMSGVVGAIRWMREDRHE